MNLEVKRECGSCNKCCEGWLYGEAYGHRFYPSSPCHFLTDGKCSIYPKRPEDPCKVYKCEWLTNNQVPGWMKPNKVNAILSAKKINGIDYILVTEAGETLRSDVLCWIMIYCLNNQKNLEFSLKGGKYHIGSKEFQDSMKEQK